jgi:putative nucleotidyltransferase-like protein
MVPARARAEDVERPDRFAWLLGTEKARPAVRFSAEQLEPACTFLLRNWQVLPIMAPKFLDWVDRKHQDAPEVQQIRDVNVAVRALARMQMLLANRFVTALEEQGVPYSLMKGSSASMAVYPAPDLRSGLDVDVAVPRRYIRRAERIAHEQGFVPAAFDLENRHAYAVTERERREVEAQHYELVCLNRRQVVSGLSPEDEAAIRNSIPTPRAWHETDEGELACYVTLDIHHGICLDIAVDEMVDSARKETYHGYTAWIPQPEWMLLQLIFKLYWEGVQRYRSRGVYQYADLVRLIGQVDEDVFNRLLPILEHYELEAGAYYVLRRLETAFGLKLGPHIVDFLTRTSIPPADVLPSEVNDMGDMWPRLWGFR